MIILYFSTTFILGTLYLPPDSNYGELFDELNEILTLIATDYPTLPIVVGGDFNCRVSNLNQVDSDLGQFLLSFYNERKSLNHVINPRGRVLVDIMESNGLVLLNGRSHRDFPANFTFMGPQRESVVDHVWCSINGVHLCQDLEVLNLATLSNHFLVKLNLFLSPPNLLIQRVCLTIKYFLMIKTLSYSRTRCYSERK